MANTSDQAFINMVRQYYVEHGRDLPWRHTSDPYHILVSELMLQQTQVVRVIEKYHEWLVQFPDILLLAQASPAQVIVAWQGLGYNRRALFLHRAAKVITEQHDGQVPVERAALEALPGIGPNTAGAIMAYAFNQAAVFIETNIRRVYIHHYFSDQDTVSDKELLPIIERTLDHNKPREWYWALMDYGSTLSKMVTNPNHRSKHYVRQGSFAGSNRALRGQILRLLQTTPVSINALQAACEGFTRIQIQAALTQLTTEGFIEKVGRRYQLIGV